LGGFAQPCSLLRDIFPERKLSWRDRPLSRGEECYPPGSLLIWGWSLPGCVYLWGTWGRTVPTWWAEFRGQSARVPASSQADTAFCSSCLPDIPISLEGKFVWHWMGMPWQSSAN
jgi:hypothetical protein